MSPRVTSFFPLLVLTIWPKVLLNQSGGIAKGLWLKLFQLSCSNFFLLFPLNHLTVGALFQTLETQTKSSDKNKRKLRQKTNKLIGKVASIHTRGRQFENKFKLLAGKWQIWQDNFSNEVLGIIYNDIVIVTQIIVLTNENLPWKSHDTSYCVLLNTKLQLHIYTMCRGVPY